MASLATRAVTQYQLSRFESGEAWPSPVAVLALAGVFGATPVEVLADALDSWLDANAGTGPTSRVDPLDPNGEREAAATERGAA